VQCRSTMITTGLLTG
nr:immunoglobulin heavy chain junction region [Mus musculus]